MNIRKLLTPIFFLSCFNIFGQCDLDLEGFISYPVCNGDATGSIFVTPNSGTSPYQYIWSNGDNTSYIFDLAPGTYTVTVGDINNCIDEAQFTITEPEAVTVNTISFDNISCQGENDGHIEVEGEGGTLDSGTSIGDYYYEWSTGEIDVTELNNLSPGTYTVTVSDIYGCAGTESYVVTDPSVIFVTFPNITDLNCNGNASGEISIVAGGGTGTLLYDWSTGETSSIISNLQAGTYSLTITDENGCTFSDDYTVNEPTSLEESSVDVIDLGCFEDNSGSVEVFIDGGTGVLDYLWSNGMTGNNISNLQAGTYDLTVTDANDCTYANSYTVNQPSPLGFDEVNHINIDCNGDNNGSIEVFGDGGTPSYSYIWSNGIGSNSISNLSPGSYTVTITDGNDCTYSESYSITQPSEFVIDDEAIVNIDCNGNENGSISVFLAGGTATYSYQWSNGSSSNSISNLSPGAYSITATDGNGCTVSETYNITQPSTLELVTGTIINVSCHGGTDGYIEATTTGGSPNYEYEWSNGATTNIITNLTAGTYTLTVTDENDCTETETFTITEPAALEIITGTIINVSCFGGNEGFIEITTTGGSPNYEYDWSNGATTNTLDNLVAGTYSVTVTDQNGCTETETYIINEPENLEIMTGTIINVSCFSGNDGFIEITTTGGSPNYEYEWSNGATTNIISNLTAGTYTLTVTDENDCTETETFTITEPAALEIITGTIINVGCFGGNDGFIEITTTGGSPNYEYDWSNGATTNVLNNLIAGTYSVTVTDQNDCTETETFTITEPAALDIITGTIINVGCFGGNDGFIEITTTGGSPNYEYDWSNGANTNVLNNLIAETYSVTVTDQNDCTETETFTITEPAEIDIITGIIINVSCFGGNDGFIEITTTGGSPNYEYDWSNGANTNTLDNLVAGTYSVTVTDQNGCTETETYTINEPENLEIMTGTIINVSCFGGNDGFIEITTTGGSPNYEYDWSNGATTNVLNNITAGTYSVTVSDENGCTKSESYTINQPAALEILTGTIIHVSCNGGTGGLIETTTAGGSPNYAYEWSNGATINTIDNLSAGTYSLTVTDENGCIEIKTFSINQPENVAVEVEIVNVDCGAGATGSISIESISGGTPEYETLWSSGATANTISELESGEYQLTVTDNNDCEYTFIYNVSQPGDIEIISEEIVNNLCAGNEAGQISIEISGGAGETSVLWSTGATTTTISNLQNGTYNVTIEDENGCILIESYEVSSPTEVNTTTVQVENLACFGDENGTVSFLPTGGLAPYLVEWTYTPAGESLPVITSSENVTDTVNQIFGAGTILINLTDSNGCNYQLPMQSISQPDQLTHIVSATESPKCYGEENGLLSMIVEGGASPYAVEWTYIPAEGTETFVEWTYNVTDTVSQNFGAGLINAVVYDDNGCTLSIETISLSEPDELKINNLHVQDAFCIADTTGKVSFGIEGGLAPYLVEWTYMPIGSSDELSYSVNSSDGDISELFPSGTVSAIIKDNNGCNYEITTQSIAYQNEIVVEEYSIEQPKCGIDSSGYIELLLSGGASPYAIEWTYIPAGGIETFVEWTYNITGLMSFNFGSGIIQGHVEDANGCSFTIDEIVLENIDGAEITEIKVTYSEGFGNIELILDDMGSDLTFEWTGPNGFTSNDQNIDNLEFGTYACVITDENDCQTLTGNIEIITTAVEEVNTSDLYLINTLGQGILFVDNHATDLSRLDCFDIHGQRLLSITLKTGTNTIDISTFPSGMYVIAITNGDQMYSQLITNL